MKNLNLLAAALLLAGLINFDNSTASQEQSLPTEIPGKKKPPLPEKMLNSPEFQAFLKNLQ